MRADVQPSDDLVRAFVEQFAQYRRTGERALAQMPDNALNRVPATEANSPAMLVRHISGNLISRFTDFLTTDGEKPWRQRDEEFADREYSRAAMERWWDEGWGVLEHNLATLGDADLGRTVTIRGQPLTVHLALCRSLAHVAYHVGQLVLLARQAAEGSWEWLSIPKGKSAEHIGGPVNQAARDGESPSPPASR